MMVNEDNVLDILRADVPHALGLEQRILAETSTITKRQPFWQRQLIGFLPMPIAGALVAGMAVFMLVTVLEMPALSQSQTVIVKQTTTNQAEQEGQLESVMQPELVDEYDMRELMLLQDEHFFAQL